jgi:hypothetical protein
MDRPVIYLNTELPSLYSTMSLLEYVRNLHTVHLNSLNEEPQVSPAIPENAIKVPLHAHQRAVLKVTLWEWERV